jgi:putative endonuclease
MREEKRYYMYIMASRSLTLYTGVTGDIFHRTLQHKAGEVEGFMKKYHINRLVYYETFKYVNNALNREKQVKAWTRAKRVALIKTMNPTWQDLAEGWGEPTKLQIPHFVRDDNSITAKKFETDDKPETKEMQIARFVRDDNSESTGGSKEFDKKENVSDATLRLKDLSRNTA